MITLTHYLVLSSILFVLGLIGVCIRKNLLVIFMCIEVMLNAVNLSFVALARYFKLMDGHVISFFIMAVAAAEAAIGLAIVVAMFRNRQTVLTSDWKVLGG